MYIYVCVCVCMCVLDRLPAAGPVDGAVRVVMSGWMAEGYIFTHIYIHTLDGDVMYYIHAHTPSHIHTNTHTHTNTNTHTHSVTELQGGMSARRKFCREVGVVFERVQEMQTLTQQVVVCF
jgi:glycerophosphoryl diester phosphodiesterase